MNQGTFLLAAGAFWGWLFWRHLKSGEVAFGFIQRRAQPRWFWTLQTLIALSTPTCVVIGVGSLIYASEHR